MKRWQSLTYAGLLGLTLVGCGLAALPPVTVTMRSADGGAAAPAEEGTSTEGTPTESPGAPASGGGPGDLAGIITFDGAPPQLPPIHGAGAAVKDAEVCSAAAVPDESLVVDASSKGIQNIVVFLEKAPAGAEIAPAEPVTFDQKGCRFLPHVLLARTKTPVMVLSDDPIAHNTHTVPKRNSEFNGLIPANDRKGTPVVYAQAEKEPFEVKCDYHPWMKAYHISLDHQFAAVTDAEGKFVIMGLPAGTHSFKVWQERAGLLERALKVTVKPGPDNKVELKYGAGKFGL